MVLFYLLYSLISPLVFCKTSFLTVIIDDMGFEDINALPTPTLHTLQTEGITLNNYYTDIT